MAILVTRRGGAIPPVRAERGSLLIGRAAEADIVLAHPMASSRHCTLTGDDVHWQLHDLSTNGTLLNGQKVTGAQVVRSGDVLTIADVAFEIRIEAGAGASARMRLDDWGRGAPQPPQPAAPAAGPVAATTPPPVSPAAAPGDALLQTCIAGLHALARDRRKARADLGIVEDAAAGNPLLAAPSAEAAFAGLRQMPSAAAEAAIRAAIDELDRHQRAVLGAMQGAFRATLDQFAPAAIQQAGRDDAAAWKAYREAFQARDGFVDIFSREMARAYRELTES
jgi:predicted component of type VI protein secretion system